MEPMTREQFKRLVRSARWSPVDLEDHDAALRATIQAQAEEIAGLKARIASLETTLFGSDVVKLREQLAIAHATIQAQADEITKLQADYAAVVAIAQDMLCSFTQEVHIGSLVYCGEISANRKKELSEILSQPHPGAALLEELARVKEERDAWRGRYNDEYAGREKARYQFLMEALQARFAHPCPYQSNTDYAREFVKHYDDLRRDLATAREYLGYLRVPIQRALESLDGEYVDMETGLPKNVTVEWHTSVDGLLTLQDWLTPPATGEEG